MAKAEAGMKLVRWLPRIAEATFEDVSRFGNPNAARVRALLDFLPTMSDEAVNVATAAGKANPSNLINQGYTRNVDMLWDVAGDRNYELDEAMKAVTQLGLYRNALPSLAAGSELLSDLLPAAKYTELTNPLAAGRAVDLLRARPRNQGTPFLDVVSQAAKGGAVTGPRDVVAASRIARSPEDIREIAITLMSDGMSAEEAMRTARML